MHHPVDRGAAVVPAPGAQNPAAGLARENINGLAHDHNVVVVNAV